MDVCVADRPEAGFLNIVHLIENANPPLDAAAQLQLYKTWLATGGSRHRDAFAAWYNIGVLYSAHGDRASAVLAYRQALLLKPELNAASINLGLALESSGDQAGALHVWSSATQPDPDRTALLNQQGRLLEQMGRLKDAERILHRSLTTNPSQPDVIQHWLHLRQKMCQWPVLGGHEFGLTLQELLVSAGPLAALALTDDVSLQHELTSSWVARKTAPCTERLASSGGYDHPRIRLGYLSSDFCNHAMSYLIAELLEQHDRGRFDIFGYCIGREDNSAIRSRVLAAFDHTRFLAGLSDEQAARTIRQDEIDILIDLNGLTAGGRPQILRWKPAPYQATYLGFVGPVPIPELDAILCDEFVIPPDRHDGYFPRPLPIAGVYQANDNSRIVTRGLTRVTEGIPEDKFVFCCFCGNFKITEQMFGSWMAILRQTGDAVLWLPEDNRWSAENMRQAACAAEVDPDRLVFAPRCAAESYMARLGLADAFLDTFPYNAGTVASDAIRMQLPIITLPGRSFASRMAAGLLRAYGVLDGIAVSPDDYVAKAVRLAADPTHHAQYRSKFTSERWRATLGDIEAFRSAYEASLTSMMR